MDYDQASCCKSILYALMSTYGVEKIVTPVVSFQRQAGTIVSAGFSQLYAFWLSACHKWPLHGCLLHGYKNTTH